MLAVIMDPNNQDIVIWCSCMLREAVNGFNSSPDLNFLFEIHGYIASF